MKGILKAAKIANGRSRACAIVQLRQTYVEMLLLRGFPKGQISIKKTYGILLIKLQWNVSIWQI